MQVQPPHSKRGFCVKIRFECGDGNRVSNTLVIYTFLENNPAKAGAILDESEGTKVILT